MVRGRIRYAVEIVLLAFVVSCFVSRAFESDRGAPERILSAVIAVLWISLGLFSIGKLSPSQTARKFSTLSISTRRGLEASGKVTQALWWVVVIPSMVLWFSHGKETRHIVLELMALAAALRGLSVGFTELCAEHAGSYAVERLEDVSSAVL